MADQVASMFSLKDLPIYVDPLPGFIRLGHKGRLSVKFEPDKRLRLRYRWQPTDIVILESPIDHPNLLQLNNRKQLEQQLLQQIALLQDLEAETVEELKELPIPQSQQRQHPWEEAVELVPVSDWPGGHRLGTKGTSNLHAVSAKVAFSRYSFIDWYKGVLLDDKQFNKIKAAAEDHNWAKYSYSFTIMEDNPRGASRVTEPGQVQQATTFNVDASCCKEGNPMAHILDYRVFGLNWDRLDSESSSAPNATLLPFSHNGTGKVYVAVIALRDISAGEEICIDYGVAYWEGVAANERSRMVGKMTPDCSRVKELKGQLKDALDKAAALRQQAADKAAALHQLQDKVCNLLPVLYGYCSSLQTDVLLQFLDDLHQLTEALQASRQVGQQKATGQPQRHAQVLEAAVAAEPAGDAADAGSNNTTGDTAVRSDSAGLTTAAVTSTGPAATAAATMVEAVAVSASTRPVDAAADNTHPAAAAPDSAGLTAAAIGRTGPAATAATTMVETAAVGPGTGDAAVATDNTLPAAAAPDSTRHALGAIGSTGPAATAATNMVKVAPPGTGHAAAAADNTLPAAAASNSTAQAPAATESLGLVADAVVMTAAATAVAAGKGCADAAALSLRDAIAPSISSGQVAVVLDRPMHAVAASNSLRQATASHDSTGAVAAVSPGRHHAATHTAGQAAKSACPETSDYHPAKRRKTADLVSAAVPQVGLGNQKPSRQAVHFPKPLRAHGAINPQAKSRPGSTGNKKRRTGQDQGAQKQPAPPPAVPQPADANAIGTQAAQLVPRKYDEKQQQRSPLAVTVELPERLRARLGPLPGSREGSGDFWAAVDEEVSPDEGQPWRPAPAEDDVLPNLGDTEAAANQIFDEFAEVWFYKDEGLVVGPKSIRMLRRLCRNLPSDMMTQMNNQEFFTQQPPEFKIRGKLLLRSGDPNAPDQ